MISNMVDQLPLVICEVGAVRDESGQIIDLEWLDANQLMNESILPEGGSIVGMRILEFDPNYRDSEMVRKTIEALETGEPQSLVTQQGRAATMLQKVLKTIIVPSADGVICCSHEITDIARERDEAVGQAKLLEMACDHATYGIVISDARGKIIYANEAMEKLTGYTHDELVGQSVFRFGGLRNPEIIESVRQKIEAGGEFSYISDDELITKSGEEITVSTALNNAFMPNTGKQVFVAIYKDVREERQKARELRHALAAAEQATRMKSEFLANMSHEIRTPLNGVLGMAQLLAQENLTPNQKEQAQIILDSGKTLLSLLNDILDLSKIEAGKIEVSPVPTDLRHKLSHLEKLHGSTAEAKGIRLTMFVDPNVPGSLLIDPVRTRQCVSNLMSNAIKFTETGEVLVVATSRPVDDEHHQLTIHVRDTGCGIAPDKVEQIFESFAQEDGSTTRRFGGTGLGLAITRKLARMMGGDVTVVSKQGEGSVFTLTMTSGDTMPVHVDTDLNQADVAEIPAAPLPIAVPVSSQGLKALVVDDNKINRFVARNFLQQGGFEITDAEDGLQALDHLREEKFDIVLLDIHMPVLDGTSTLQRLRGSDGINRDVPVVALTADSMAGDKQKYLSKGFDAYISKPIDEREFASVIAKVISATGQPELREAS